MTQSQLTDSHITIKRFQFREQKSSRREGKEAVCGAAEFNPSWQKKEHRTEFNPGAAKLGQKHSIIPGELEDESQ